MSDVVYVFDLDGTIAPYKKPVPQNIANRLNQLGHIYIITGGTTAYAQSATNLIKNKTVIGLADDNQSIDLSKVLALPKWAFFIPLLQKMRMRFVEALNVSLRGSGLAARSGGRSTIDMQKRSKFDALREHTNAEYIFFYDCKWDYLVPHSNDWPLILHSKLPIRTDWKRIIRDINNVAI